MHGVRRDMAEQGRVRRQAKGRAGRLVEGGAVSLPPLLKEKCGTCPFREGSPHANLAAGLAESALTTSSRICHSTGSSAIYHRTGKPEALCRGARDVQLAYFYKLGVIPEPTDEAWAETWARLKGRAWAEPSARLKGGRR